MMPRTVLPATLLCLLALGAGGKEREKALLPVFSGALKHLDGKSLALELDDFRTLEFRRTAKTRFFDKKKALDPARLKPGDALSVEATQDIDGTLIAVNVYLEHAAQAAPPQADELIPKARTAAEAFSQTLPNYVCRQVMTRFESRGGKSAWKPQDVVTAEVVYENGREDYREVQINGKPVKSGMEALAGSWSTGEFGSILHDLFSAGAAARFSFRDDAVMAGRAAAVYGYEVERANSHWELRMALRSIRPAYRGAVWIDKASGRTLRIEMQATGLGAEFPIEKAETINDYAFVRLGDNREYLLPVHAETLTCERATGRCALNRIDFRDYRKYSGEAVISFDETGRLR